MPRITLVLEDSLFKQMKIKAAAEGRTLQAVTNELIRRGLAPQSPSSYRLKLQGWTAELQPGMDLLNRNSLFEVLDRE